MTLRLRRFFMQHLPVEERRVLEGEIVRKCLARSDKQCSFVEHRSYKARPSPGRDTARREKRWSHWPRKAALTGSSAAVTPISFVSNAGYLPTLRLALLPRRRRRRRERARHPRVHPLPCARCGSPAPLSLSSGAAGRSPPDAGDRARAPSALPRQVETMDKYFGNVCELDIMFNLEKAHYILDEMVMNGTIVETSRLKVLMPVQLLDKIEAATT